MSVSSWRDWSSNFLTFIFGMIVAIWGYNSSSTVVTVCGAGAALVPFISFILTKLPQSIRSTTWRVSSDPLSELEAQRQMVPADPIDPSSSGPILRRSNYWLERMIHRGCSFNPWAEPASQPESPEPGSFHLPSPHDSPGLQAQSTGIGAESSISNDFAVPVINIDRMQGGELLAGLHKRGIRSYEPIAPPPSPT
ncbi:hypothetical protein BT96DRAFT_1027254 [Gymnopus androsaceus JB14]|uniref:Uncharacterized protein n=1 Tax=Gymnopus androsaceus JB14 TaxID=1447944 RepID=A0A6A4GD40_9AGAR|nr:hypothetical protein BT96DRAFT_1027254 [Gymnopus androsaceus JB14]